ncbi:MAG: AraC family transcriptional regulator [Sphingomonadales bacterium]|nr:AraC family transcriptional regulator [Sphingomonadales bacterium]
MNDEEQLPVQHARVALSSLGGSSRLMAQVFAGSGLSADVIAQSRFPFSARTLETVANNMARLFGPGWYLGLPVLWSLRVQSEFGGAIRSAATLGDGLGVIADFLRVRWPMFRAELVRGEREAVLALHVSTGLGERNRRMLGVLAALNFQTTVAAMIGGDVARLRYAFEGERPDHATQVEELVLGACGWGHAQAQVHVPLDMLDRPSLTADEDSLAAMLHSLRGMAAARDGERLVEAQVRQALRHAPSRQSDAASIAAALRLSRRTMERRLRDEGTSFRVLHDEAYKARLLAIAADPRETAESVAEQMGYHDASSLQRACRRWFGRTFGRVRAELGRRDD